MPNSYFRFRQFIIRQERCAMKVCTDACLFGAWVAAGKISGSRFLDIGTGTGLLSLMVAQKTAGTIDAVEIDAQAAGQASENFRESPWSARLHLIHASVQQYTNTFAASNTKGYDLIFSNPPFFHNDLKSTDHGRNLALHGDMLGFDELILYATRMLASDGLFAVLVPYHRSEAMADLAQNGGLYILEKINIRQTHQHPYFRTMYLFCRNAGAVPDVRELVIRDHDDTYSQAFNILLEPYYLLPDKTLR